MPSTPELAAAGRAVARLEEQAGSLPTPCWVFTGARQSSGYGVIRVDSTPPVLVHRLLYRVLVGPVPAGLELHHECENPPCANPAHLEPVTHFENHRRTARARMTHCSRGHAFTPENTRRKPTGGGRSCRRCERNAERARRGYSPEKIAALETAYQERVAA